MAAGRYPVTWRPGRRDLNGSATDLFGGQRLRHRENLSLIWQAEPRQPAEGPGIVTVVRKLAGKVIRNIVLRLNHRVPKIVGDRQPESWGGARIGTVPELTVEGDERPGRTLDRNRFGGGLRQRGGTTTQVRPWHTRERSIREGVIRQALVAVGRHAHASPGLRHLALIAVQPERLAVPFARPLHETVM